MLKVFIKLSLQKYYLNLSNATDTRKALRINDIFFSNLFLLNTDILLEN